MKLASVTDFSQHRLCQPGKRHLKLPNRRSPREVQLIEGRPIRPDAMNDGTNPIYLIRLENVDDREEAMKMRGCILFALEEDRVDDLLEEDEYIVSDLVGLNVYLDENMEEHSGRVLRTYLWGTFEEWSWEVKCVPFLALVRICWKWLYRVFTVVRVKIWFCECLD